MPWRHTLSVTLTPTVCYRGKVKPGGDRISVRHAGMSVWHVRSGSAFLRTPERNYRLRGPCWILVPPDWPRYQEFSKGYVHDSLSIDARWADGTRVLSGEAPIRLRTPPFRQAEELIVRLTDGGWNLSSQAPPPDRSFSFHSSLSRFFYEMVPLLRDRGWIRERPVLDARIENLQAWLTRNPTIRPLPMEKVQEIAGLSREQVDRLLRDAIGYTLSGLQRDLVARQAERLLLTSPLSIKEIASKLEFTDSSHFCRWFSKQIGTSPGSLRRGQA